MIVQCRLKNVPEPFLLAVNHWKSLMTHGKSPAVSASDRAETADWLGDWLANRSPISCAIVVGDFNAEPTEPYFSEFRLRGSRRFSTALWTQATPAYLYNTAWKFLSEPLPWEDCIQSGGAMPDTRPKRTHDGKWVVWDQMMASGAALTGRPLRLIEKSVHYHGDVTNSKVNANGAMVPVGWSYDGTTRLGEGASDHYPVLGEFGIT
jgi:hypothetical protein